MPAAAAEGTKVHAFLTFHVRNVRLAAFCDAAAELITAASCDKGKQRFDLHRELPWARAISNEDITLFMMIQTWDSGAALEAHTRSAHAMAFNASVMKGRMLVTEPSVSIFGEPISPAQLAELGAQAFAAQAAEAAEASALEQAARSAEASATSSSAGGAFSSSGKVPLDASLRSGQSSTAMQRADSRSSVLRTSGAMALQR
eukprot:TRINITY_DN56387_c0_g1_i1.p1 TRINITY_DN56387_c0_g1~~TRINITY_DN56387_c0_g1_i1.p1  ORF type:complete len:202 (-),score=49.88 TRINITY_DN56387_c0_g1_i1:27-632(-)